MRHFHKTLRRFTLGSIALVLCAYGCRDPIDTDGSQEPLAQVSSASTTTEQVAAAIVQHPLWDDLSARVEGNAVSIIVSAANMGPTQAAAAQSVLEQCLVTPDASICVPEIASFGVTAADMDLNRQQALQIAADLQLGGLAPNVRLGAFRKAALMTYGSAGNSTMVGLVVGAGAFTCDLECQEDLGNTTWILASYMDGASYAASSGAGDDDDGGAEAAALLAVIPLIIEGVKWLERIFWNSGEEDKECVSDDDCPPDEFCHKIGDNDCRDDKDEGALCTRNAQCITDCCKPHISAAFLPICRPASKCN